MLRRLEKRILVDLPIKSARSAMFSHHLPPAISQPPLSITTQIDYDRAAEVSRIKLHAIIYTQDNFAMWSRPRKFLHTM